MCFIIERLSKDIQFTLTFHFHKMSESNVVKTNYGPVRGLLRKSVVGEEYLSFRGIPYGKPPIGELRFRVSDSNQSNYL